MNKSSQINNNAFKIQGNHVINDRNQGLCLHQLCSKNFQRDTNSIVGQANINCNEQQALINNDTAYSGEGLGSMASNNIQNFKRQKENISIENRPQWNSCLKLVNTPNNLMHPKNQTNITKKQFKKQQSYKRIQQFDNKNKIWQENKNKKLFQKARIQFLREKQFCYFTPKVL